MSDLLPSELKECGSLVFEYVDKNTPNVVKEVLSCSLGTLVSGLETLDTEISYTGDSVRKILREEFGVNQCLAQDLGDVVKLGGSLAVSLLPGKLINSAVEGVKLMKLSAAGGPGSGFKFVLEDPKPKYRSLNLKDNGGISGSNGLGFKKFEKKAQKVETRAAQREVGNVGTYEALAKKNSPFNDGKDAHHILPQQTLKKLGLDVDQAPSIVMTEAQHAKTLSFRRRKYGPFKSLKEEVNANINNVIEIMKEDGSYSLHIEKQLRKAMDEYMNLHRNIFK